MGTKPCVEDFPRIYAKDLVGSVVRSLGHLPRHYQSTMIVDHRDLPYTVTFTPTGSYFSIRDVTWELVPHMISNVTQSGICWYFLDHTGRRVNYLLIDGDRIGSRLELRQRYRSQRCHNKKKARARLRKRYIDQLVDTPVSLEFCMANPNFLPDKPIGRRMYWSKVRRIRRKLLAQIAREQATEELPWAR